MWHGTPFARFRSAGRPGPACRRIGARYAFAVSRTGPSRLSLRAYLRRRHRTSRESPRHGMSEPLEACRKRQQRAERNRHELFLPLFAGPFSSRLCRYRNRRPPPLPRFPCL
ncbi:unnamed protein product [Scytosiphon promiscuus]